MSAPLYDNLKKIRSRPFYMPGHKRKKLPFLKDLLSLDFTELPDTDNLHCPVSHILSAQTLMASLCGSDESFFLVNGSSCGIMAAIFSVCSQGDKILIGRNSHISVYNAIALTGAYPLYISPEITDTGLCGGITPASVSRALSENPDIKAFVITSPTYEGFLSDISEISKILHSKNKLLIVDEAHGAAFPLSPLMPPSAIALGADIVIHSWHKTLPVLTQTSVAHICGNLVNRDRFKHYLSIFQSTSPSFVFMAVLDKCREYIQENGDALFEKFIENIKVFRQGLAENKIFKLINPSIIGSYGIKDIDLTRLVFIVNSPVSGTEIDDMLFKSRNIRFEAAGMHHLTAVSSIADSSEDLSFLASALEAAEKTLPYEKQNTMSPEAAACKTILTPYKASEKKRKQCPFDSSAGFISAEYIIPYPPGIPIIVPGELITEEVLEVIRLYKSFGIPLNGIKDPSLEYIQICQ